MIKKNEWQNFLDNLMSLKHNPDCYRLLNEMLQHSLFKEPWLYPNYKKYFVESESEESEDDS